MDEFLDEEKWHRNEIYSEFSLAYILRQTRIIRYPSDLPILRFSLALKYIFGKEDACNKLSSFLGKRYDIELINDALQYKGLFKELNDAILFNTLKKTKTQAGEILSVELSNGMRIEKIDCM